MRAALHHAAWIHARVIRVHPFEDGNGGTSRLILNAVLVSLGVRSMVFDAVKQEYFRVLNHYFTTDDLDPLVDLMLLLQAT